MLLCLLLLHAAPALAGRVALMGSGKHNQPKPGLPVRSFSFLAAPSRPSLLIYNRNSSISKDDQLHDRSSKDRQGEMQGSEQGHAPEGDAEVRLFRCATAALPALPACCCCLLERAEVCAVAPVVAAAPAATRTAQQEERWLLHTAAEKRRLGASSDTAGYDRVFWTGASPA